MTEDQNVLAVFRKKSLDGEDMLAILCGNLSCRGVIGILIDLVEEVIGDNTYGEHGNAHQCHDYFESQR